MWETRCGRCRKQAPDYYEMGGWGSSVDETGVPTGFVCPRCIRPTDDVHLLTSTTTPNGRDAA